MPYISQERREWLYDLENYSLAPFNVLSPGELNYLFTLAITSYVSNKGLNYQTINDILGALEGAKQEFYRRVVVPYEDQKIKDNGDVY